jgi:hypothetical protein
MRSTTNKSFEPPKAAQLVVIGEKDEDRIANVGQ